MVLRCASNKRLTNVNNLCKLLRVLHFELGNVVLMNHALNHQELLFLSAGDHQDEHGLPFLSAPQF
jgi:hypothetical protein